MSNMIKHTVTVPDYEHSGDLVAYEREIKQACPHAKILRSWEEEDLEAMYDYEDEYGEMLETMYQGYIEFELPEEYENEIDNL